MLPAGQGGGGATARGPVAQQACSLLRDSLLRDASKKARGHAQQTCSGGCRAEASCCADRSERFAGVDRIGKGHKRGRVLCLSRPPSGDWVAVDHAVDQCTAAPSGASATSTAVLVVYDYDYRSARQDAASRFACIYRQPCCGQTAHSPAETSSGFSLQHGRCDWNVNAFAASSLAPGSAQAANRP